MYFLHYNSTTIESTMKEIEGIVDNFLPEEKPSEK